LIVVDPLFPIYCRLLPVLVTLGSGLYCCGIWYSAVAGCSASGKRLYVPVKILTVTLPLLLLLLFVRYYGCYSDIGLFPDDY